MVLEHDEVNHEAHGLSVWQSRLVHFVHGTSAVDKDGKRKFVECSNLLNEIASKPFFWTVVLLLIADVILTLSEVLLPCSWVCLVLTQLFSSL